MRRLIPVAGAAICCAAPAEPLVTDRPDFTESAAAVDVGRLQLEVGYTATFNGGDPAHALPEALLRIGLAERTELRLGWGGLHLHDGGVEGADGEIGIKHVLDLDDSGPLALGFIASLTLPTGGGDATGDALVPVLKLLWSVDVLDGLSIAGNINFSYPTSDAGDRIGASEASLALALALTSAVGVYAEYFGLYPWRQDAPEHYINGGVTLLLTDDLQLDARIGAGLNDSADDLFAGVGLSVRF